MVRPIIDFDKQFEIYTRKWLKENQDAMSVDEMEARMPELYLTWLETPADWLDGEVPQRYFDRYEDAAFLLDWLLGYMSAGIGIPGPLMDRIASMGDPAYDCLLRCLRGETAIPDKLPVAEVRMTVLGLLSEIGKDVPVEDLIAMVAQRSGQEDEVADMAADCLLQAGEAAVEPILSAMEGPITDWARASFLDVLSNHSRDARIFDWMAKLFTGMRGQRALFASYLGKYGDPAALPLLEEAIVDPDLSYLDYLEIRNAIEELGGHIDIERDFSGDDAYESLKRME